MFNRDFFAFCRIMTRVNSNLNHFDIGRGCGLDVLTTTWLGYMYGAAGLLLGSFLNVVGFRMPRSESIVFPGSHCPACKTSLKPFELIPVLSWFILRGRCRYCSRNISLRYPVIEL